MSTKLDFLRRALFQCHENSKVYIHKDTDMMGISIERRINNFSLVSRNWILCYDNLRVTG